jgi:tRNA-specific 2-thiouridylase
LNKKSAPKRKLPYSQNKSHQPRVVVAMSGGVDSSVAAALLVEQGYEVVGMMMRLWSEPGREGSNRCCTPDSMAQAKQVAAKLDIPFYAIDAKNVFYDRVVQFFIDGYTQGVTPNPCLVCNQQIRWEFLLNRAQAFGAQFMATGHYARLLHESGRIQLLKAVDQNKDQSYVLHVLNQKQLSKALFPLGEYEKPEIRQLAREFDLPVAERADSQDLCFLGDGDYRDFLRRNAKQNPVEGKIINTQGQVLGTHQGLEMYTNGQRRGLGLSAPHPLYVINKNQKHNTLMVGTKEELMQQNMKVKNLNWVSIDALNMPFNANVKIRYTAQERPARIKPDKNGNAEVEFRNPIPGITPGQAAVFYQGDTCLGGGIIEQHH